MTKRKLIIQKIIKRQKFLIANKNELVVTVRHSPYNMGIEDQNNIKKEVKDLVKLLKNEGSQYFFYQLRKEVIGKPNWEICRSCKREVCTLSPELNGFCNKVEH